MEPDPSRSKSVNPAESVAPVRSTTSFQVGGTRTHPGYPAPTTSTQLIARFEIIEVLGEGAFGRVYRCRDPQLHREVAVKVPKPGSLETPAEVEEFLKEARAAANISHPNICAVYEAGEYDGRPFIVMGLVPGVTLAKMIEQRKGPMDPRQAVLTVRKLALALGAAHAKGVIHRDLKPTNVVYDKDRKELVVMDFGLARRTDAEPGDAGQTRSGVIMGTPAYMSPEQAAGRAKEVGPQADVWALGVILYELLTGRRPFTGSVAEVLGKILYGDIQLPSELRPELDPRLETVCLRALARDPGQRYATMKDLADALSDCLKADTVTESIAVTVGARVAVQALAEEPGLSPSVERVKPRDEPSRSHKRGKTGRGRHPLPWGVTVAVIIAIASFAAILPQPHRRAKSSSDADDRVSVRETDRLAPESVSSKQPAAPVPEQQVPLPRVVRSPAAEPAALTPVVQKATPLPVVDTLPVERPSPSPPKITPVAPPIKASPPAAPTGLVAFYKVVFPGDVLLTADESIKNRISDRFPGEFKGVSGHFAGRIGYAYLEPRPDTVELCAYIVPKSNRHAYWVGPAQEKGARRVPQGSLWVPREGLPRASRRFIMARRDRSGGLDCNYVSQQGVAFLEGHGFRKRVGWEFFMYDSE